MRRRRLLAGLSALSTPAVAGCLDGSGSLGIEIRNGTTERVDATVRLAERDGPGDPVDEFDASLAPGAAATFETSVSSPGVYEVTTTTAERSATNAVPVERGQIADDRLIVVEIGSDRILAVIQE